MRIVFAGSPTLSVPALEAVQHGHQVCAVLTKPDQPKGRSHIPEATAVKLKALELGLTIFQPEQLDRTFLDSVNALQPELLVAVAFGKIFKQDLLELFPYGGINLHPSLLPKHRGPSPIPAAILAGDNETGVSIQRLALKMDAGAILAAERLPLSGTETTGSLSTVLSEIGSRLLVTVLGGLEKWRSGRSKLPEETQREEEASYCRLVEKNDGCINWAEPAELIERKIRAYYPWPGSFSNCRGRRLTILAAGVCSHDKASGQAKGLVLGTDKRYGILINTGKQVLYVTRLQLQAKKALDWQAFLNGQRDFVGTQLGGEA